MFKRKVKKLVKNPKLFFSDMVLKHSDKVSHFKPKKMQGNYQYTVISAIYNVDRYLNDFIESLIKQRLDFRKHIQLILVDDGSIDNSAEIIQRWQKRYPHNITYIYKENGGQASARNIGLKHVKTEWVTFIDPDDFVSNDYFLEVDKFIIKNSNLSMVACNLVFYYEDKKQFSNTHPLRFRFENDAIYPIDNLKKSFQLSASSAFFLSKLVKDNNVTFDERIKPNFEDGHFIATYLSNPINSYVGFAKKPIYYYRKRSDGSSTLDTSWEKPGRYSNVLEYGYLNILEKYKSKFNIVPLHIQRSVLYDMMWHFKRIVNNPEKLNFLTNEQKNNYLILIDKVFKFIDKKTILDFELAGSWFYHKVGILSCFKNLNIDNQIAYIEDIDRAKNLIQIRYFTHDITLEQFFVNSDEIYPSFAKTIKHDFLERTFVLERRVWVNFKNINDILTLKISGKFAKLSFAGKQYKTGVSFNIIKDFFDSQIPSYVQDEKYQNAWLLMDRDTQADDNAEHLYRYISNQHPDQSIFFVLSKNSHDWLRLEKEGFNLIEFDSQQHKAAVMSCSKIISSHADKYVTNLLGPKMLSGRHFVFLQHGIIKDDLSNWLNQKEAIDCFVTSTANEYKSISDDYTRYKYSNKEVKLTGLPRHDQLINCKGNTEKLIVIMPTWRRSIVGTVIGDGNSRMLNPEFMKTTFASHWYDLLHSKELKSLSQKSGYKIAFFPHANIQPYLKQFDTPEYIDVISHKSGSIQDIFSRAVLMITDYSSVAFEMAIQDKQSIYYQFDEDELFSGGHVYSRGYFDYRTNGFGPVVTTLNSLIDELKKIIHNDCVPTTEIKGRIDRTFPRRDGRSCQKTFEAIKELDNPLPNNFIDINIVESYAEHATRQQYWTLSQARWEYLLSVSTKNKNIIKLKIAESLREQGKFSDADKILKNINATEKDNNALTVEKALLAMRRQQWELAIYYFKSSEIRNEKEVIHYLRCLAELQMDNEFNIVNISIFNTFKKEYEDYKNYWKLICEGKKEEAVLILEKRIVTCTHNELVTMQPQLLLANTYCQLKRLTEANQQLSNFEKHTNNSPFCREIIAQLAYLRKNWNKVIVQVKTAYPTINDTPEPVVVLTIKALQNQKKELSAALNKVTKPETIISKSIYLRDKGLLNQARSLLVENRNKLIENNNISNYNIEIAKIEILLHNWQKALSHLEQLTTLDYETGMMKLKCLAELRRPKAIRRVLNDSEWFQSLPLYQYNFAESLFEYSKGNTQRATTLLNKALIDYRPDLLIVHKPYLWLARCLRELGQLDAAHNALLEHEKLLNNDPQCREQIARLAIKNNKLKKAIFQLEKAYPDYSSLPLDLASILVSALRSENKHTQAEKVINCLPIDFASKIHIDMEYSFENMLKEPVHS